MKKRLLLTSLVFFTLLANYASAQLKITGRVLDDKKQAAAFANVLVLSVKDSSLVKGDMADADGRFSIESLAANRYILQITAVGFQKYQQPLSLTQNLILEDITLKAEAQALAEVQVTARKQLIERSGDKLIMNVEASPTAAGLNGLELLEKVPGVTIDRNSETIKLKGKEGVLVMIDDRKTYLTSEQLAAYLKTLKSDDIESIEVIANPSARYDASGSNGIINIKTKKGKMLGTNYILDLNYGYSHYSNVGALPKNGQGFTVNSRREKYVLYANINRQLTQWYNSEEQTQYFTNDQQNILETRYNTSLGKGKFLNWSGKLGFDYDFSKKTSLGFSAQINLSESPFERNTEQKSVLPKSVQQLLMGRNRLSTFDNYTFNTHFRQNMDTAGTVLTADFDVILLRSTWNDHFATTTTIDNQAATVANNQIYFPTQGTTLVGKLDFTKKLTAKTKLETGLKNSFSSTNKDFNDNFRTNGDLMRSFFHFRETIAAGYFMLNTEISKNVSIQAGLRGEYTDNRGSDINDQTISSQQYFNLFPTLTYNQKVTKDYAISLGYSRRINRPDGDVFNTFQRFFYPQTYVVGNPTILPSLNNTVTLSNTFFDKYSFSLSYVGVNQFSTDVYDVDSTLIQGQKLIRESSENVSGKIGWWSIDASLPLQITKWWNANVNLWGGINVYQYSREQTNVDIKQPYGGAYIQQTFTLSKTLSGEISGWINSGETWGFQTSKPQGGIDFGLKQFLVNKKVTVKFLVQDPFNFNNWRNTVETVNLTSVGTYRWDNRRFRLSLTYNFGNTDVKPAIQHNEGNDGGGGGKGRS